MKAILTAALVTLAACLAPGKARACEPPKPDALVGLRFADSLALEEVVQHAARSSCVEYRFDKPLARRGLLGPVDIQVRGADLDATYAILFRTMNIGVEGRGRTRKLVATGPEPEAPPGVLRLDKEITRIDDRHARITRNGLDGVLGSMAMLSRAVRVVPEARNGKAVGFRLFGVRPRSVFDLVGFRNGDTVLSVNDIEMATPDQALLAYTKVKTAGKLRLGLERNGAPFVLEVEVVGPPNHALDPPDRRDAPPTTKRSSASRAELDDAFHHPRLRMVPSTSAGKPDGIRLFSVHKAGPVLETAGFLSADLVRGINAHPVTTIDSFGEAFGDALKTNRIEFSLLRAGQSVTLVIDVR